MGFLPFGKGKDSIEDDSSSLTSSSTANVESSIPRTTIEADGVKEKKFAEASGVNGGGLEGKDVIDDSISKGRVMLEQLKAKYNNASSTAPASLKSLNVPSMKSREADVLILEEKVSRMTNELNVAIREKGVAKMQLEEITAESLLLKINLKAKKEEMTLRHERAAKAILTLQKREEEAEERIAEMKKREERANSAAVIPPKRQKCAAFLYCKKCPNVKVFFCWFNL